MTHVEDRTAAAREADAIARRLADAEGRWARLPLAARIGLLRELRALVDEHAGEWVETARQIKRIPEGSPAIGEEWTSGPWPVMVYLDALIETLVRLDTGADLLGGFPARTVDGGRTAIRVLPATTADRLLLTGYSAEVWLEPGVDLDDARHGAGLAQRRPAETRGSCLVLGAGNITSIAPLDVLYVLFADNRVAVLKLNPVMDRLLGVFEKIFAPFREIGAVEIITGGIAIGSELATDPSITAVHMTGSEQTHDAIVWGPGETGIANKAAGTPLLTKPMSSELGGVSPVIVVPGRWSAGALRHQARHVATMRLHNTGSNCIAGQILVVSADWTQKDDFLREVRLAMVEAAPRPAWYPGAQDRVDRARSTHAGAVAVGGAPERTLLTGLDADDPTEPAFSQEFFGPVLGVVELPGAGQDFLDTAVDHANDHLRGTLGANVIIRPRTRRALGAGFDRAVARMRYGTIGLNAWTGVGYLTPRATWGAFPGHALDDIQSGHGVVHNALLLERTERTVVSGPFRPRPQPAWFVGNRSAATTGRRLTEFTAHRGVRRLLAVFASALRG